MTSRPRHDGRGVGPDSPTPDNPQDDVGPGAPAMGTPRMNIDDVMAKLNANPSPEPYDIGSPEADVLAQAAEVLDGAAQTAQLEHLVAERTDDLQRLQAEYANYRKRVERDRAQARTQGAESVVRELVPVLDAIAHAQEHEELTGGFKAVASELARVTEKLGLVAFGAVGDEFDPTLHEALMQLPSTDVPAGFIAQIIQPGYKLNDTVLRPARVAVAAAAA